MIDFEVRFGTDGIGQTAGYVKARNIDEARARAATNLRVSGYVLQADRGLFTVHGIRP